jgi:hypothetical protein
MINILEVSRFRVQYHGKNGFLHHCRLELKSGHSVPLPIFPDHVETYSMIFGESL